MSKGSVLKTSGADAQKVENFREALFQEAETLFSSTIPEKILHLSNLLKDDAFCVSDLDTLKAPLDIPIPDPPAPEDEEMETDKGEDEKKKKKPPKCGYIKGNEKIVMLLERVRPEIVAVRQNISTVSCWLQLLIPKIEDGNDFGVAVQEKILERITEIKTKVDAFQTSINKHFLERGDVVVKASKENHVMDYRTQVQVKDEAFFRETIVMVKEIIGVYAEVFDIICKNLEKVTNPKGEEKPSMY